MPKAADLPRDELQRRFDLSSRLTARIGALMAKGLRFTHAVLELAGSEAEMADLLLSPALLDLASSLTTSRLQKIGESLGLETFLIRNALVVSKHADSRLISLKDEMEAEAIWAAGSRQTGLAIIAEAQPVTGFEVADLLSNEELDSLKLTILTSADPNRKIEAIRKLVYAKLDPEEKGRLLISALSDGSADVKVEATRALAALGLSHELSLQIRQMLQGEDAEKNIAARALARLASHGSFLERAVVFVVVSDAATSESFREVRLELLTALRELADIAAANDRFLADATGALFVALADSDSEIRRRAKDALAALVRTLPERVGPLLWNRLPDVAEPKVRSAIISAIGGSLPKGIGMEELARAAIGESLNFSELEPECWQLRALAVRLGEASVGPLLSMLPAQPPENRLPMYRLVDALCREAELSAKAFHSIGEAILDALTTSSDPERVLLLEVASLTDERFPSPIRRRVAGELLACLGSGLMAKTLEQVEETIVALGPIAIEPIVDYVKKEKADASRFRALRAAGAIASEMTSAPKPEAEWVADAASTCIKLIESGVSDGTPLVVLGQLCSRDFAHPSVLQSAAKVLGISLRKGSFPFQALDGLGWLASNPAIPRKLRLEVANSLLRAFESKLPDKLLNERATAGGTVFDVGPEASAYNEMIPAAIEGLARISSVGEDEALRDRIIDALLGKWHQIQKWEEVWGPVNVALLADALGRIASTQSTSEQARLRIARALSSDLGRLSVVRALGQVFGLDSGSAELGVIAQRVAEELLEARLPERGISPEEREPILRTLGVIASRGALARNAQAAAGLRARIVSALEAALRDRLLVAHEWLAKLGESEALSEFQRKEILRRLSRFERIAPR